jgi:pimeloyl-ACP methyl ester carboxylesterase
MRIGKKALALGLMIALSGPIAQARAAPQPAIPLAQFDALKKTMALPNGVRLAYIELGNPAGRPVVLVHGYTDNARDWWPMLPYLDPSLRLILVDLRGHGASSKPECCYTRLDFAYDIKLLLDGLGVARADIVGHSLGSIITQTFAEFWPVRTDHVVLISSTGGPPKNSPAGKPAFDFRSAIAALKEPIDPNSPFMVAWWASPKPVDEAFIRRQREDSAAIPLRVWLAVLDQGLVGDDLQASLPKLKAPTLLIWGSADPIMEPPMRETLRTALPSAKVRVFEGLGHNPFWEDPAGVAAEVNVFLASGEERPR